METQKDIFSNIGSFNDFASERGLCTDDQEAFTQYTNTLNAQRARLAQELRIPLHFLRDTLKLTENSEQDLI